MLPPICALGTRRGVASDPWTDVDVGGGPRATSVSEPNYAGPVLPDRGGRVSA